MICEAHYDCSECSESQREAVATAHAAAIQAASKHIPFLVSEGIPGYIKCSCGWDSRKSNEVSWANHIVFAVTLADAQRLYDLRIAEAVKDEANWWHAEMWCDGVEPCQGCKRLASASAEVERLKGLK